MKGDNEWLDSSPEVYSVTIAKFPTAAEFPIEIQGFKTKSLFDTWAQVSNISYDCYKEFTSKTILNTNVTAKVSSADGSNLGPLGVVKCS